MRKENTIRIGIRDLLIRSVAFVMVLLMTVAVLEPAYMETYEAAEATEAQTEVAETTEAGTDTSDTEGSRIIGILFDNSGSMYKHTDWCRALYAMETFAAMAEEGDTILIYPMHPITVGVVTDEEIEAGDVTYYTSSSPLVINGGVESSVAKIREIYTPEPGETPIESLEAAYESLSEMDGEKWFVILTDGYEFDRDDKTLSDSEGELSELLSGFNDNINVMYLGIGSTAVEPVITGSGDYVSEVTVANDSAEVLADMIAMANIIYGRSEEEVSEDTLELKSDYSDVTILVQGTDASDVALSDGESAVTSTLSYALSYSTTGQGKTKRYYKDMASDTDLAGVLVIYENVPAGTYTLTYSGTPDSISVSYSESTAVPDADSEGSESTEVGETGADGDNAIEGTEDAGSTEIGGDSTKQSISITVDGTEGYDSSEFGDAESTKDTTPGENDDSANDSLFENGHWVVLGVIAALIVFAVIWMVMHQRIFPERITLDQTYYEVDGEEMAGEATIEGGRELTGKTARITVRAPEVPGKPDIEFGITFEIKPVDYRCMKSHLRRIEIVDITDGNFAGAQVLGGSVAASKFVWDASGKCYVDESKEGTAGKKFGYTVGSTRTYRLNGIAHDGDREMEVELSFVLQYR